MIKLLYLFSSPKRMLAKVEDIKLTLERNNTAYKYRAAQNVIDTQEARYVFKLYDKDTIRGFRVDSVIFDDAINLNYVDKDYVKTKCLRESYE